MFRDSPFDVIITVCDSAAETCPTWLGPGRRLHISFPDPAKASGSDAEVIAVFRDVRDTVAREIPLLLQDL